MSSPQALFSVAGKNVLVTGGSRGIGLMIASTFFHHGANVLLTSRDPKACQEAAASINSAIGSNSSTPSNKVHHVASNVSTREGCKALANHTSDIFNGRLDVLVNNAGCSWGEDPGYDKGSRESGKMNWGWDKVMDLNVKGMFYLTRECVPMLQRREVNDNNIDSSDASTSTPQTRVTVDPGRVINIGSITGFIPQNAPTHAYEVSKAAVHHLTKKLASDLAPRGITVNAIAPGYVKTRMSSGLSTWLPKLDDATEAENVIADTIPLGRMGNADDMGGAAIFLSSKAGSFCTGHILAVDGGSVGCIQIPLSNL